MMRCFRRKEKEKKDLSEDKMEDGSGGESIPLVVGADCARWEADVWLV